MVEEAVEETAKPDFKFDFFGKMSDFFNKHITVPIVEEEKEEAISESS